ncbi:MAG: hypothetical protein ACLGI3_06565 [Actinomycetes bacterium]
MRTPVKLAAFGGVLALAFTGALGVGTAIGDPLGGSAVSDAHGGSAGGHGDDDGGSDSAEAPAVAAQLPGGLMVSDRGYTLDLVADALPAGAGTGLAYRIVGADGEPVTAYEPSHDKDMHLIAVRRDTTGFQHVHPALGADGTWRVPLDLTPGSWRVFADFVPATGDAAGETLTLGADLAVAGDHRPQALPPQSRTTQVDGYTVTLDGDLVPGKESELTLSVSRDGQPVTDLQPYLAAYGHLVALRVGDLAYLHVHPAGEPGDGRTPAGPDIIFYATAPSTGDYRLFLDFQHDGVVRTAEFTGRADSTPSAPAGGEDSAPPAPQDDPTEGHDSDGHAH